MWKLKIVDGLVDKISFDYEFDTLTGLTNFIQANEDNCTTHCKYIIENQEVEEDDSCPFDDIENDF